MPQNMELGPLTLRIKPDVGSTLSALRGVQSEVNRLQMASSRLALAVTTPITIAAGAAMKAFSDFDDAMTASLSIYGKVTADMRSKMESTARAISERTRTTATEIAKGYGVLISAGFALEQSMQAVAVAEKFAMASFMELDTATTLLAQSQFALGLAFEDPIKNMRQMQRVADVLSMANAKAAGTIEQFARALASKGAPALRAANKSLEEGVAALMVYAERGRHAEIAGELLNVTLRELDTVSRKFAANWRRFGVAIYDSRGNMRKLWEILGDMEKRLAGMSPQAKAATLAFLGFTDLSSTAIKTLLGTSGRMKEFYDDLQNSAGKTSQIAADRLKSFASQLKITWNQIVGVGIDVGGILAPALGVVNEYLRHGIKLWKSLSDEQKKVLVYSTAVAALLAPAAKAANYMLKFGGFALGLLSVMSGHVTRNIKAAATSGVGILRAGLDAVEARAVKAGKAIKAATSPDNGEKYGPDSRPFFRQQKFDATLASASRISQSGGDFGLRAMRNAAGELAASLAPAARRIRRAWWDISVNFSLFAAAYRTYGVSGIWQKLRMDVGASIDPIRRHAAAMLDVVEKYRAASAASGIRGLFSAIGRDIVGATTAASRFGMSLMSPADQARVTRAFGRVQAEGAAAWVGISSVSRREFSKLRGVFRDTVAGMRDDVRGLLALLSGRIATAASAPLGLFGRMVATIRRDAAKFKSDVRAAFGGGVDVSWVLPSFRGVWGEIKRGAAEAARSTRLFDVEFMRVAADIPRYLGQARQAFVGFGKTVRMGSAQIRDEFVGGLTSRFASAISSMKQRWRDFTAGLKFAPAWNSDRLPYKLGEKFRGALNFVGDSMNLTSRIAGLLRKPLSTAQLEWNRRVFRPYIRPIWVPFKREWLRPVIAPVVKLAGAIAALGSLGALIGGGWLAKKFVIRPAVVLGGALSGLLKFGAGAGIWVGSKFASGMLTAGAYIRRGMTATFSKVTDLGIASARRISAGFGRIASAASNLAGSMAAFSRGAATETLNKFVSVGALLPAVGGLVSSLTSMPVLLAAAGYAFVNFTETGRNAFDKVSRLAKPTVKVIVTAFKGIKDAFAGGDLRLAADIAWAGLKLSALTAFTDFVGIADNAISRIVTRMAVGDMQGAWDLTVAQIKLATIEAWGSIKRMFHDGVADLSTYLGVDLYAVFANVTEGIKLCIEQGKLFAEWAVNMINTSPRLTKWLTIAAVIGISGIGRAAKSAATAVSTLVSGLLKVPGGLHAIAIVGIVELLTGAGRAAAELNAQLQKTVDLEKKLAKAKSDATDAIIARAGAAATPEEQKKLLEDELATAQRNLAGAQKTAEDAKNKLAAEQARISRTTGAAATDWIRNQAGASGTASMQREVDQAVAIYESAQDRIKRLQSAINDVDIGTAEKQKADAEAKAAEAKAATEAEKAAKEIEKIKQDMQKRLEFYNNAAANAAKEAKKQEEAAAEQLNGLKDNLEDYDGKNYTAHVGVTGETHAENLAKGFFQRISGMRDAFNRRKQGKVQLPAAALPAAQNIPVPTMPNVPMPKIPAVVGGDGAALMGDQAVRAAANAVGAGVASPIENALKEATEASKAADFALESAQDNLTRASSRYSEAIKAQNEAVGAQREEATRAAEEAAGAQRKAEKDLAEAQKTAKKRADELAETKAAADKKREEAPAPRGMEIPLAPIGDKAVDTMLKARDRIQAQMERAQENANGKPIDLSRQQAQLDKVNSNIRKRMARMNGPLKANAGADVGLRKVMDEQNKKVELPIVPDFASGIDIFGGDYQDMLDRNKDGERNDGFSASYLEMLNRNSDIPAATAAPVPQSTVRLEGDAIAILERIATNTGKPQITLQQTEVA